MFVGCRTTPIAYRGLPVSLRDPCQRRRIARTGLRLRAGRRARGLPIRRAGFGYGADDRWTGTSGEPCACVRSVGRGQRSGRGFKSDFICDRDDTLQAGCAATDSDVFSVERSTYRRDAEERREKTKRIVTAAVTLLLRVCDGSDLNFAPILPMCYGCYGSRGGRGGTCQPGREESRI